jgi:hypothetical protein
MSETETETGDQLPPEQIHAVLFDAFKQLETLRGRCDLISSDSAFAIGCALGGIDKAKALVGRDIDQNRSTTP